MKKGFLSFAVCLMGLSAAAQQAPTSSGGENVATRASQLAPGGVDEDKATNIHVGLKAGGTLAHFQGDNRGSVGQNVQIPGSSTLGTAIGTTPNSDYILGAQGGVFVNIGLGKIFSIQPELLYTQRGSRLTAGTSGPGYLHANYTTKLHYLDIPVALRLTFGGVYLEGGPQLGLQAFAREKFKGTDAATTKYDASYIDASLKTGEFSYFGGIGYTSPIGLGIGARYNRATTNVVRTQNPSTGASIPATDAKSAWAQLFVSYTFQ